MADTYWKIRRAVLWSATLDRRESGPLPAHVPMVCRQVFADQLDRLMGTIKQMDSIGEDAILKRFRTGRQCFGIEVDGTIAAYGWLTRGPEWVGEFDRELHVLEDEAYIWDCATLPTYRRQRLFSTLLCCISEYVAQENLRRVWIIANNSAPSLVRNMNTVGFRPILGLNYLQVMGFRVLVTTAYPEASSQHLSDARRLLKGDGDRVFGPLVIGYTREHNAPETHVG